jgi:YegS/Rv2252/BmrU family lipid kinase
MQVKRVHVIVNPASGQDRPILKTLNSIFRDNGIEWEMFLTKEAGDGVRLAKEAAEAGVDVVAVYGGDGTVREVTTGLLDTDVPVLILPGGTANAMALALGVPTDLAAAANMLVCGDCTVRQVDIGVMGDECFLIGIGIGIPGEIADTADREAKDRLGILAYFISSIQALRNAETVTYRVTIDGNSFETEGVSCVILNAGQFGIPGVTLAPSIDMSDSKLDLLVFKSKSLPALVSLAAAVVLQDEQAAAYDLYQGHEITVEPMPLQPVQVDGEVLPPGPVSAKILPCAGRYIVPAAPSTSAT